ncbi:hypothetical protein HMPREF0545_0298 [Ligilactobacillus salivarius DSM 20555 = ATCC 11741]|uniref:Uncharacterized protein n=1 Tax=Ligilactobacillus salivarius DSM 20555 = ATCC 11741 TaxID=1423799 RepID=C2EF76_9LACO|nr:hypothetical protein HMPREF0545_0298 [Ligilactobacillus salivarius DSM 20555 = ATCC 11741]
MLSYSKNISPNKGDENFFVMQIFLLFVLVRTYLRIKETESNLIKVDKRKRKLEKIIYNIDN